MTQKTSNAQSERRRGSGVQHVYDLLRDEILSLALPPGTPVDEVQLAERFGMSRTPIREALVRLASDGLVETLPNRSTLISSIDVLNLSSFFDALTLMYRVTTRLAARHHQPEDLVVIRKHQAEFAEAVISHDALAMISTNREFHAAIATAGRNPYYTSLFVRLLDDGRRLLRLYYRSFNDHLPEQYVHEHEEMVEAIASGDVDRADILARAHADQIVGQIQKLFAPDRRHEIAL